MSYTALEIISFELAEWQSLILQYIPNILAALIIFLLFFLLASLAKMVAQRVARHSSPITVQIVSGTTYIVVVMLGLLFVLQVLQLDTLVTSLLAGAGIIGLSLGLAFQDFFTNFMAGFSMSVRTPFDVGDLIKTNDTFGKVQAINLRTTVINSLDGQMVEIPNKDVYQNPIINYSELPYRRIILKFGVGYDTDLTFAQEVIAAALAKISSPDKKPRVYYSSLGESAIEMMVLFWIDTTTQVGFFEQRSQAIKTIIGVCRQHQIELPYPIQTVRLTNIDHQ